MAGHHHHHDEHHFAHPASIKMLLAVFFALIFLTILTVATSGKMGPFGTLVAMAIATAKAILVCMFFMHMYGDKAFNLIAFLSSFVFVSLFIGFTMLDTDHYQNDIDAFPRAADQVTAAPAETK
jgi:cytochrome c oxidase subunit 4